MAGKITRRIREILKELIAGTPSGSAMMFGVGDDGVGGGGSSVARKRPHLVAVVIGGREIPNGIFKAASDARPRQIREYREWADMILQAVQGRSASDGALPVKVVNRLI